jgi:hypothetical protein
MWTIKVFLMEQITFDCKAWALCYLIRWGWCCYHQTGRQHDLCRWATCRQDGATLLTHRPCYLVLRLLVECNFFFIAKPVSPLLRGLLYYNKGTKSEYFIWYNRIIKAKFERFWVIQITLFLGSWTHTNIFQINLILDLS